MRAELADDVGMYVAPTSQIEVVLMATTGYTVVVPYTVADEIAVIVCTFEVDCVTITHGGVEVCVMVRVTVGMLSSELQNGVATCCSCMIDMTSFTALQLSHLFSSTGDAKATPASTAMS